MVLLSGQLMVVALAALTPTDFTVSQQPPSCKSAGICQHKDTKEQGEEGEEQEHPFRADVQVPAKEAEHNAQEHDASEATANESQTCCLPPSCCAAQGNQGAEEAVAKAKTYECCREQQVMFQCVTFSMLTWGSSSHF